MSSIGASEPTAPDGSRATSMRRPARVKPFFLGRANHAADCRPTGGTVSLSLSSKKGFLFDHRYRRSPTNGRRIMLPSPYSQITDSPYFHPHSLWSDCSGASWVSSIWKRVLPSRTRTECLCFQRRRSWRVPQSPELGDLF